MKPMPLALLTCGLFAGTPALASDLKAFYFGLKRNTQTVEGVYVVDGYSFAEMRAVMGQYCKGGQIGQFTHVGKPRKKRGALLVYEQHPIMNMFEPAAAEPMTPVHSYFRPEPFEDTGALVYWQEAEASAARIVADGETLAKINGMLAE